MSRVISADVPDELFEEVEDRRPDDESRSSAVRRYIRAGLDAEERERHGVYLPHRALLVWAGATLAVTYYADVTQLVGQIGLFLAAVGILLSVREVQIRDVWDRYTSDPGTSEERSDR
jgi:hypothetical protein